MTYRVSSYAAHSPSDRQSMFAFDRRSPRPDCDMNPYLPTLETGGTFAEGIDAVEFTRGSTGGGKGSAEQVDYGDVRNVLAASGMCPHAARS